MPGVAALFDLCPEGAHRLGGVEHVLTFEQLDEHDYHGDREQVAAVMSIDVELNAQGLEVWLERRKR